MKIIATLTSLAALALLLATPTLAHNPQKNWMDGPKHVTWPIKSNAPKVKNWMDGPKHVTWPIKSNAPKVKNWMDGPKHVTWPKGK